MEANALIAELRAEIKATNAAINVKDQIIASLVRSSATEDLLRAKDTEIALLKASAAKDMEIMELRMQLARAEQTLDINRTKIKDAEFANLVASAWPNTLAGVNCFSAWPHTDQPMAQGPMDHIPIMQVEMADGIDPVDHAPNSDVKHRHFGFCYEGPAISTHALVNAMVKEAYTVEVDHLHYVCIVLHESERIGDLGQLIYTGGLLTTDIKLCQIPDREHQISVYKPYIPTTDPVLEMLKQPSHTKWCWRYSRSP